MAEQVIINEVGPRDGLQNQSKVLTPNERVQLIEALIDAGLPSIEVGAFVSPKAVPAMAGTDNVVAALPRGSCRYSVLIPNRKGYELARASGVEAVGLVIAASNTMNQKNIRMDTEQAMAVCREVIELGRTDKIATMAYIATAWECPFEGRVAEHTVLRLTEKLFSSGATEVIVADTIGAADPAKVNALMAQMARAFQVEKLSCHFHDTRGQALANIYAAIETGIRKFDASIGGLGGCPFSPGATGNVATEDAVLMLESMGFETGINLEKLVEVVALAESLTGNCEGGHSLRWLKRQAEKGLL